MFSYTIDSVTRLKLFDANLADPLFNLIDASREHLRTWLPWVDGTITVEDTRSYLEASMKQFTDNRGFAAAIWHNGSLAGVISYHAIDWANRRTSIGYWLAPAYLGKGLMTKSCQALLDYAFFEMNLNRIEIRVAVENHRSRAVPERLGFVLEGTIREVEWFPDGRCLDHAVYGMLANDWITNISRYTHEQ